MTVLGELNPDIILSRVQGEPAPGRERVVEDVLITIGSSSAICATILARLGARVRFVGRVGADWFGRYAIDMLQREGVTVSVAVEPAVRTGLTVAITGTGERMLLTFPGAMATTRAGDLPLSEVSGTRHLHFGSFYLQRAMQQDLPGVLRWAVEAGMTTSLDPGHDPAEAWTGLEAVLPWVDVLILNQQEAVGAARALEPANRATGERPPAGAHDAARALASRVRRMVVVKCGGDGAFLLTKDGDEIASAPFPVEVVDSTGAGDAFDAGFLAQWLRGARLGASLEFANACGAIATTYLGGTPGFPGMRDVLAFMARHGRRGPASGSGWGRLS